MSERKAVWVPDYDFNTDTRYERPGCAECHEPVGLREDGLYHCYNCGEAVQIDETMEKWFADRAGEKVETGMCIVCKANECETHYRKNLATMKWQAAWGKCRKCGAKWIV